MDLCTGYSQANISLKVPPGIGGMAPGITLRYNAGTIDEMNEHWIADWSATDDQENARTRLQASPVGLGWSFDLGGIFRSGSNDPSGHPQYYLLHGNRTFELAWVDGTNFRTRPDDFLQVRKLSGGLNDCPSHEYWLIEARDGTQYRYGYRSDSEQRAGRWQFEADGTQHAWQWRLDQVADLSGNRMDVEYEEVSAQPPAGFDDTLYHDQAAYPLHIHYTANSGQGTAANREVRFIYSSRNDSVVKSGAYAQYYWTRRLDRVEMYVGGSLARAYDLVYSYLSPQWHTEASQGAQPPYPQTAGLQKLVLTSITEKDGSGNSLPATSFAYYSGTLPGSSEQAKLQLQSVSNGYGAVSTYLYEGHSPDGWWKLPRRYRVREVQLNPGTGTTPVNSIVTKSYSYGTSYNVAESFDYRGHDWVRVTDAEGHYSLGYFYTRDAVNGKVPGEVTLLQSRPYRAEAWASGASAYTTREETDWAVSWTDGVSNFIHAEEVRGYVRTLSGGTQSKKTRYGYDSYGNTVSVREYDDATKNVDQWARQRMTEFYPRTINRYLVGFPARKTLVAPNGDVLRDVRYCYDGSTRHDNPIGSGLYCDDGTSRARLTAVRRVLDPSHSVDVTYGYDGYGHRTSVTEYGSYGVPGGFLASEDARTTTVSFETAYRTYPYQVTNPLGHVAMRLYDARWGVPAQSTDADGGVSDYTYDGFGRLTRVEGPEMAGPGGSYRPTTQHVYYLPTTTGNGRTTTMLKIQVRTDLGGVTPTWRSSWRFYDGVGRVVQQYAETAGGVNVANGYYGPKGLKVKDSTSHLGTGSDVFLEADWAGYSGPDTRPSYDELGRVTRVDLPDGLFTRAVYDGWHREGIDRKGHKRRYEQDWAGRTVAVREYTGTDPWTLYATTGYGYDLSDQLLKVTDALGNPTTISYDALGRKTSMIDPDMGSWSYEYHATGTLKAQTDARGQRIELSYDRLGRLVRKWYPASWNQESFTAGSSQPSVCDLLELRCAIDTDLKAAGLTAASWTDPEIVAGTGTPIRAVHWTELRSQVQALWTVANLGTVPQFGAGAISAGSRSVKTSDPTDLRRWLSLYERSGYGETHRARAYYEYDSFNGTDQFGRGRRTAMWDGCGRHAVYYDRLGRVWKEERTVDGHLYSTLQSYDSLSRQYQMTYPDGEVLTYSYGANGLVSQMVSSLGTTLVSGVQYNPLDQPSQYDLGGGASGRVSHSYYGIDYQTTMYPYGALRTTQWPSPGSNLVNRVMSYDQAGNVSAVNDLVNSENIGYSYDDLDRLLSASIPAGESYGYNQVGNITTKNGLSYSYSDPKHIHAVTSFNGTSYGYDANGCMTTRGSQAIGYDAEMHPIKLTSGGSLVWRAAYDGDGVRRKRLDSKGTIHYLGSYERSVGNGTDTAEVVTKYYQALGRSIAYRKNGTLYWVGTDHLGGTIRVADAGFSPVDQMRYTPYGVARDAGASLGTDHRFTSQVLDETIGLYWYNSRAYDPAIGRFTDPDTVVPGAENPQALNRYSYVVNSPLKYVDVLGRSPVTSQYGPILADQSEEIVIPLSVDINANITEAWSHRGGYLWLYNQVKPHARWDYKYWLGEQWEAFGNWHFGVVGAACGFEEEILTNFAGLAQLWRKYITRDVGPDYITEGFPIILPPYGDDHRDYDLVRLGIEWYYWYESTHPRPFLQYDIPPLPAASAGDQPSPAAVSVQLSIPDSTSPIGQGGGSVIGFQGESGSSWTGATPGNASGDPIGVVSWDLASEEDRRAAWFRGGSEEATNWAREHGYQV